MSHRTAWVLTAALALAPSAWGSEDWINPPPAELVRRTDWVSLATLRQHAVVPEQRRGAAALLQERPLIELKPKQAWLLAGQELDQIAGAKPYLVRAVSCATGIPGYDVQRTETTHIPGIELAPHDKAYHLLWVKGVGAGQPRQQEYSPLVVMLSIPPQAVFVTCTVLE